jgi:hypothetical protein
VEHPYVVPHVNWSYNTDRFLRHSNEERCRLQLFEILDQPENKKTNL